ncbi:hypothetical protein PROFUN_02891 [Planoprotostelium fungivorum]|uniref:Uncharacterized protein n=1 Tax=Planoprotostelium fungivorum TaxID=1890364 RepID=A0A2P6NRZ0_9EUKA|nr:hypothetical protein PROFUN_02891 [Planoprotostelium fungivorum]
MFQEVSKNRNQLGKLEEASHVQKRTSRNNSVRSIRDTRLRYQQVGRRRPYALAATGQRGALREVEYRVQNNQPYSYRQSIADPVSNLQLGHALRNSLDHARSHTFEPWLERQHRTLRGHHERTNHAPTAVASQHLSEGVFKVQAHYAMWSCGVDWMKAVKFADYLPRYKEKVLRLYGHDLDKILSKQSAETRIQERSETTSEEPDSCKMTVKDFKPRQQPRRKATRKVMYKEDMDNALSMAHIKEEKTEDTETSTTTQPSTPTEDEFDCFDYVLEDVIELRPDPQSFNLLDLDKPFLEDNGWLVNVQDLDKLVNQF